MGSPIEFKTPSKGVVKNTNFQDFTPEAAIDAMNVRPFTLDGRLAVSQRSGTDKLYVAALTAAQPVQGMIQTTLALDPATVVPGSLLVDEHFNYSNGSLGTVSSGIWTEQTTMAGESCGTGMTVVSSACSDTLISAGRGARYTTAPVIGAAYVIKTLFTYGNLATNHRVGFAYRMDPNNVVSTGWVLRLESNGAGGGTIRLTKHGIGFASNTFANGTLTANVPFTLELDVNGENITGKINGASLLTAVMDGTDASNSSFGFFYSTGGAATSQTFTADNFQVFGGASPANLRQTNIVAVCAGNVYQGDLTGIVQATGGGSALSTAAIPSMCFTAGIVYMVDGFTVQQLNLTTKTVTAVTASAGSLPTQCTLAAVWRDRLVLAAPRSAQQNFFMSRVNVPTDFDYSQLDPAAAFAGNASTAGHIGEPIVSLIPFSDDVMFIGGDHNFWAIRGDPKDGGSIDLVSDAIGIVGANAWTKSPDGALYFVGTGGLYKIMPGSTIPENISNASWNEFFRTINRAQQYVLLDWDRDQQGLYIFVSNVNASMSGGTSTHMWYDQRTGGLWPLAFPDNHGPVSSLVYDGDGPTDRTLLLGCRDGFVRRLQLSDKTDDGTAISSFVYLGPFKQQDNAEALLQWIDVILGAPPPGFTASDWNCQLDIVSASTVEKALNAPLYNRRKIFTSPRRQVRWMTRIRGTDFFLKLSNAVSGKTFSYEKATGLFTPAGTVRRR